MACLSDVSFYDDIPYKCRYGQLILDRRIRRREEAGVSLQKLKREMGHYYLTRAQAFASMYSDGRNASEQRNAP